MLQVLSYQIADSIDIKQFKAFFKVEAHYSDSDELFYKTDQDHLIYVFKYGVVCFFNYDPVKISEFLKFIEPYCKNPYRETLSEEFQIETGAKEMRIGYNKIEIVSADIDTLRLIMLNVSQSVALDYYSEQATKLMEETNFHTLHLERKGSLAIPGRNLKKYIGRTLNLKNRIAENLYIFDAPPEVWDDENLNRIDTGLKKTFDLQERFRNIQESLSIVKENFDLFKDILQNRNSTRLEWVIIILISIEVLHFLIDTLF